MIKLFEKHLYNGVVIYLDDILIYSKTISDHNKLIDSVFRIFQDSGMRINPKKCHFFSKTNKILRL